MDQPDKVSAVATAIVLVIFVPVSLLGFGELVRLRSVFPIKGRSVSLLAAFFIPGFLICIYFPIAYLYPQKCILVLFELHAALLCVNALLARAVRLWFLYYSSQERLKRLQMYTNHTYTETSTDEQSDCGEHSQSSSSGTKKQPKEKPSTWFEDHRYIATTKFMLGVVIIVTIAEFIVEELLYVFGPDVFVAPGIPDCPTLGGAALFGSVAELGACFAFAATLWRLRHIKDSFRLKVEMMYDVISGGVLAVVLIFHRFFPIRDYTQFPVFEYTITLSTLAIYISMFYFPVWLAKRHLRHPRGWISGKTSQVSQTPYRQIPLKEMLTSPDMEAAREDFTQHLSREFALENLQFWNAVYRYEEMWGTSTVEQVNARAVEIYAEFVSSSSPSEANLDHETRHTLGAHVAEALGTTPEALDARVASLGFGFFSRSSAESQAARIRNYYEAATCANGSGDQKPQRKVPHTVFSTAANAVLRLMENDTYLRWKSHAQKRVEQEIERPHSPTYTHTLRDLLQGATTMPRDELSTFELGSDDLVDDMTITFK